RHARHLLRSFLCYPLEKGTKNCTTKPLISRTSCAGPRFTRPLMVGVELNRFAGLSGRGDFRDWGPDFCFHPQCEETEDDTPSATDDHRHAGAWLFPSNPPGLSAGGSRLGQVLSPAARPA